MKKSLRASAFLILSTGLCKSAAVAGHAQDEAAIRDVQREQADAWNRHDAAAYARLFSEDGDV
jgi:hypothetical protein